MLQRGINQHSGQAVEIARRFLHREMVRTGLYYNKVIPAVVCGLIRNKVGWRARSRVKRPLH